MYDRVNIVRRRLKCDFVNEVIYGVCYEDRQSKSGGIRCSCAKYYLCNVSYLLVIELKNITHK